MTVLSTIIPLGFISSVSAVVDADFCKCLRDIGVCSLSLFSSTGDNSVSMWLQNIRNESDFIVKWWKNKIIILFY